MLKDHRVIVAQLMESGIFNLDNDREDIVTNLRANYEIRDLIEHGAGPMFALLHITTCQINIQIKSLPMSLRHLH